MSAMASSPWPIGHRGAVSLTFDDGRPSQLGRAVPILAEYGLTGTFYLNFPWNVEHATGPTLVGLAEQATELGRWVIFTIHDIGDGSLPLSEAAFRALCRHLARRRDEIWTAPVVAVARRIAAWRQQRSSP
ncbi:MAG: polysaccharide deacetylase family protein [Anaerolineae bacterium]